jgi:hypothetical protein
MRDQKSAKVQRKVASAVVPTVAALPQQGATKEPS